MGKSKTCHKQDASITVYLSLILLLVLSLVFMIIEGARQTAARVVAERALTTAMDSVLAGYYGPLMDEYHLLGLFFDSGADAGQEINGKIENYMSYTINPGQNSERKSGRFYGIPLKSLNFTNRTGLADCHGSIFIQEVTDYMKYKAAGNVAENLLDNLSLLEEAGKVSIIYEEKAELEEEAVVVDEGLLALMKYIDGVSTGKKGLLRNKDGKLKTEKYFVKKILFETPAMESTGINNNTVFLALRNQYINPSGIFESIKDNFDRLKAVTESISMAQARQAIIQEQIKEANSNLQQLKEEQDSPDKVDKAGKDDKFKQINDLEIHISDLENAAADIEKDLSGLTDEKSKCINAIAAGSSELKDLVSGCLSRTEQAAEELEQIIKASENIRPRIVSYEENLKKYEKELNKEIYENLEEDLKNLKKYLPENEQGYDFLNMKEILKENYKILSECETGLNEGYEAFTCGDYAGAESRYNKAFKRLLSYKTKELRLDYSSLVIQKDENPDFIKAMKDLIKNGITGLVIDADNISAKKLDSGSLPSEIVLLSDNFRTFSFSDLLDKLKAGSKKTGLNKLFGSFDDYAVKSLLGDIIDEAVARILLIEYINEHFYEFTLNNDEMKERKPSALNYEKEYLIYGRNNDRDNLEAVIMKLVFIRTVLNFISILTDESRLSEAKVIASAMVGFTGLPVLITITQSILLIMLALASGLVDTCALLMGKKVSIIKKQVDLNYGDLLRMTGEYIEKKAKSYNEEKGIYYDDYLTFFLYLTGEDTLAYRMMGLIQENIRLRYGTDFNFQDCIFGFGTEAVFQICCLPLFYPDIHYPGKSAACDD